MDGQIVGAIITASATLTAVVVTYILTRFFTRDADRQKDMLAIDRRKSIAGKWKGESVQNIGGTSQTMNLEIEFTNGKKIIEGEGHFISASSGELIRLSFTGDFTIVNFLNWTTPIRMTKLFNSAQVF